MTTTQCIKTIKDPVHGTIELFPLEQRIIDHPVFQRLRQVSQQGLTCYTFPSDQHSRAPHSFGTMHFAGEMLKSAIENSHIDALEPFLADGYELIKLVSKKLKFKIPDLRQEVDELIGTSVGFDHKPHVSPKQLGCTWSYKSSFGETLEYADAVFVYKVLWQSIRIASLVHDIGHLPFSHTFEEAIKLLLEKASNAGKAETGRSSFLASCTEMDTEWKSICQSLFLDIQIDTDKARQDPLRSTIYASEKDGLPYHEQIGILLCERFEWDKEQKSRALWTVATTIGRLVFACEPIEYSSLKDSDSDLCKPQYKILQALHTIVSGELDADRLDYCIRDPASAAVHQDSVDSQEIVRNMQIVRVQPNSCDRHAYAIAVRAKAIPYIETYFLQRYMGYRTIINHHNVMRFDCILKITLSMLIELADRALFENNEYLSVFRQMGYYPAKPGDDKGEGRLERVCLFSSILDPGDDGFEKFDDAWVRTLMRLILEKINEAESPSSSEEELKLLLGACLYRHSDTVLSVAKNEGTFITWKAKIKEAARNYTAAYRTKSEKYPESKTILLPTTDEVSELPEECINIEEHAQRLLCKEWSPNALEREATLRFQDAARASAEGIIAEKYPDDPQKSIVVPLISFANLKLLDSRPDEALDSAPLMDETGDPDPGAHQPEEADTLPIAGRVTIACSKELRGTDLCDLAEASSMLQSMNESALPNTRVLHLAFLGKSVCEPDIAEKLEQLSVQLLGKLCAENAILSAWYLKNQDSDL